MEHFNYNIHTFTSILVFLSTYVHLSETQREQGAFLNIFLK